MLTILCKSYAAESAPDCGCVLCVMLCETGYGLRGRICCVYELIEGVIVTDLLLCNQYLTLREYLHI